MKTLVLYSYYTDQLSYYDDWIDAFTYHRELEVASVNVSSDWGVFSDEYFINPKAYKEIIRLIESAKLIILHHSMNGDTLKFIVPFISALKNRRGKLVSFVGNEVNLLNIGMGPKIELLKELNVDIIVTQLLLEAGKWLYIECTNSSVISLPHGLNPSKFYSDTNLSDRRIDIGTRSAKYGVYLGDDDRNRIIDHFRLNSYGLKVNFGLKNKKDQRFNRNGWRKFLNDCKATLATEAGSFYLQPNDEIVKNIEKYLAKKSRKLTLIEETLIRRLHPSVIPSSIRQFLQRIKNNYIAEIDRADKEADFKDIYDRFFANAERPPVYTKCISSRHFDAIGTCTLQIMYPGRYNNILSPNEHYFELKKDHSNIEDLLSLFANPTKIEAMTSSTLDYIINNHTHKHRVDRLLEFI